MAGRGSYYEICRTLSSKIPVTLALPNKDFPPSSAMLTFCHYKSDVFENAYQNCRSVICQGHITKKFPFLLNGEKPLVIDLYDLIHIEEMARNLMLNQGFKSYEYTLSFILNQLKYGDFFICATERQRDFWLGLSAKRELTRLPLKKSDFTINRVVLVSPHPPQLTKRVRESNPALKS